MQLRYSILSLCLTLAGSGGVYAQTTDINVVSSAVPFLQIAPDARSGGMGDVSVAATPDAYAIYWNAAKTVFSSTSSQVGVTYIPWLREVAQDVYLMNAAGYYKLDDNSALSGGFRYFNLGNSQFTDANGNLLKTQQPREYSIDVAYARKLASQWAVALTFKYISSSLAAGSLNGVEYKAGKAFASDISVYYDGRATTGDGFTGGLTLSNMGTKIGYTTDGTKKSFLPANLGIGVAYHYSLNEQNKLSFEVDGNHLMVPAATTDAYYDKSIISGMGSSFGNKAYQLASGVEYSYNNVVFLRGGYHWETKESGDSKFFTAGVGLKYQVAQLNFSYLNQQGGGISKNPLSNTFRFSVLFDIGK